MEFRVFELPRETKFGSKNPEFEKLRIKIKCLTKEGTLGSSYREFGKIESLRNRDSTVRR